jgi:cutinase
LSAAVAERVNTVVLFGDPNDGQPLQGIPTGDVVTFCFDTDLICDGAPVILPAHLSYALDAPAAARFVASHVQV